MPYCYCWNFFNKKDNLTNESFHNATLAILTPAAGAGIVLMIVQWVQIGSFCPFCLLNSLLLIILFGLSYKQYKGDFKFQLSISQWVALVLIALLPITVAKEVFKKRSLNNVIGVIAGEEVTLGDFKRSDFNTNFLDLNRKINQLKWEFINQKVLELEAKKNNLPLNNYVQSKVLNQISISEEEMRAFYEENKHEVPGKSFEEVKTPIRNFLSRQKEGELIREHIKSLAKKYSVEYIVGDQKPINVRKNKYYSFSMGKKDAKVKVIEFADMQCGHCKHAYTKFKKIFEKYKNDIYFEYRHYPLPGNRFSKSFAKGSYCAGEEGKFFDFIELSFANQKKLGEIKPGDLAKKLGLETDTFDKCMKGYDAQHALEADIKEANRIGIQSTPTFIINGQLFIGAISEEDIELML